MNQQLIKIYEPAETKVSKAGKPYRFQDLYITDGRESRRHRNFLFDLDDAGQKPGVYELGPKCRLDFGKDANGRDALVIRDIDLVPCKTAAPAEVKTGTAG